MVVERGRVGVEALDRGQRCAVRPCAPMMRRSPSGNSVVVWPERGTRIRPGAASLWSAVGSNSSAVSSTLAWTPPVTSTRPSVISVAVGPARGVASGSSSTAWSCAASRAWTVATMRPAACRPAGAPALHLQEDHRADARPTRGAPKYPEALPRMITTLVRRVRSKAERASRVGDLAGKVGVPEAFGK